MTAPRRPAGPTPDRGSARAAAWLPLLPAFLLYGVQFVLPLLIVAVMAFMTSDGTGVVRPTPTLDNFAKVLGDSYYLSLVGRSLLVALVTAITTAIIGYPIAWALARSRGVWRSLLLVAVMLPLMTSSVIRAFGWMVLFAPGTWFTTLFGGLATETTGLLYTFPGLIIAMTHMLLPMMILSLYGVIEKLEPSYEEAAATLGSGRVGRFLRIVLPLTTGGLVAGMLLVFASAASLFVTPRLIGGPKQRVLATEIYDQTIMLLNWPLASAMAVVLLVLAGLAGGVYSVMMRRVGSTR